MPFRLTEIDFPEFYFRLSARPLWIRARLLLHGMWLRGDFAGAIYYLQLLNHHRDELV
jgi:hypothetical protein